MNTRSGWILICSLFLAACNSTSSTPSAAGSETSPTSSTVAESMELDAPNPNIRAHGGKPALGPVRLPYSADAATIRVRQLSAVTPQKVPAPSQQTSTQSQRFTAQALAGTIDTNVVALKVLVIAAGKNDPAISDPALDAAKAVLSQEAISYDVLYASDTNLTQNTLVAPDGTGKYQGVMLTTGGLGVQTSTGYESAFNDTEWAMLWDYEKAFKVRQLALYTYPGTYPEDYGIRDSGNASGSNTATVTSAGQQVFTDLKAGTSIPINYAYNYPSTITPVSGLTTTALLGSGSNVLAVQSNTSDGRERIALTMDHNPFLLHSQLFAYGLINWLTKGVYLGEFRRYLKVDVDDWFIPDDVWVPTSTSTGTVDMDETHAFRISASDALAARDQQNRLQTTYPVASGFKLAVLFNAGGATLNAPNTCSPSPTATLDPLSSVSRCMYNTFDWTNHSRDHESMDVVNIDNYVPNYTNAYNQFKGNLNRARRLGLQVSTKAAVSGEHSGLGWDISGSSDPTVKIDHGLNASNPNFLSAVTDTGIQFLGSNRAVLSHWDPSCLNCGVPHPMNANLFLVPRWPTNIFYYASTPEQVESSYNSYYGPNGTTTYTKFTSNQTYDKIIANETEIAMNHVLSGSMFPHYMHQSNLKQYMPGKSLVYDWTNSVLNTYSQYSTLPLKTLLWNDLGPYLKQRTAFIKAGVTGTWNRSANTITLTSPSAVTAFVSGAQIGVNANFETYGATVISRVTLAANTPTTYATK